MNKNVIYLVVGIIIVVGLVAGAYVMVTNQEEGDDKMKTESDSMEKMDESTATMDSETSSVDEVTYMDVDPEAAYEIINSTPDLVVIDVSPHYDEGHLPGAIHYYLGDGSLDEAIPTLDKNKPYLVYCHVDSVAIAGAEKLIEAGIETVYRLEGNYGAWEDAGLPVEK